MAAMHQMANAAENGESYDQMIGENNPVGNARVQAAIDGLIAQTRTLEKIIGTLGIQPISFEGSDSLDAPKAVFK
jgi:putative iron-regulated protein